MTAYRPVQESDDGGDLALKGGGRYSPGSWAPNGCSTRDDATSLRPAANTPAVPKMGVRARIADWPPKRDGLKDAAAVPGAARDAEAPRPVLRAFQNGPLAGRAGLPSGLKGSQRLARRRSKDTEFQDGWPRSPGRGFLALRNRSSSEVTLSECDSEEAVEARGAMPAAGLPLFREYGSASSIDAQGRSEQSFSEMLKEFRSRKAATPRGPTSDPRGEPGLPLPHREKPHRKGLRAEGGWGDAALQKGWSGRAERGGGAPGWLCQKRLAHYDAQSMLFNFSEAAARRATGAQRRNTTTGASAASAPSARPGGLAGLEAPGTFASPEELSYKEDLEPDPGDDNSNALLLSCPHFRNEIGGERERSVSFSPASMGYGGEEGFAEPTPAPCCTNASISILEVPPELQRNAGRWRPYSIEHVDLGASYYQEYFWGKEHFNYFGVDEKLGPVAVSIRREKLEDHRDHGPQYQYRIIVRTSELTTLRGAILEDATPATAKHGTLRGLPLKEVLEHVVPELNTHCLRLALSVPRVTDQLRKLDEQGLSWKHKVGILYCRAAQASEEEMYSNAEAGPALQEFLALLGEVVRLRGFAKYSAQLDTKTDSTGTHSLYTTFQGYEIMFHVSTMLPYTPNNRQQLLRKRHIGNDIVTIIFQEPGALPFTPQTIRSHFQHVFVVVSVQNPCTEDVCYSVAVSRSKEVPPFGPAIPSRATFRKSDVFRNFLLAKVINAEKAAQKSDKFRTMATRTRQEYLKDLAENCVTSTPIDATGKFNLISLASKKKEKTKARTGAEQDSAGALTWQVLAQDYSQGGEIGCVLGISNEFVVLLDLAAKDVVFNCFCADVIGWTPDSCSLKIFYGRGDHILVRVPESSSDDIKEVVQRLKAVTPGCETVEMPLRRNGLGQLGFHVRFDGTVAEVEDYSFAWQAGLREGSRLVEICKVAVVTLSHDQMIDWLRTSVTVKVVLIPPHEDGVPRRGWAESFKMSRMEPRREPERLPVGFRPPHRSNSAWQWSGSTTHHSSPSAKWAGLPGPGQSQSLTRTPKPSSLAPHREAQAQHSKRPASFPETPLVMSSSRSGVERILSCQQPLSTFPALGSLGATYTWHKSSPENSVPRSVQPPWPFEPLCPSEVTSNGDTSSSGRGLPSQESSMERPKPEPLWHVPGPSRLSVASGNKRTSRQEPANKDSPNRPPQGEGQAPSSHSSSNTPSSSASSSHGEERWLDSAVSAESSPGPPAKGGASSDSGIDASSAASVGWDHLPKALPLHEGHGARREATRPTGWGYCPGALGRAAGLPSKGDSSFGHPERLQPASLGGSRAAPSAHVHRMPPAEGSRAAPAAQSASSPLSLCVAPERFSKPSSKHLPTGWRKGQEAVPRPAPFTDPQKQVDLSTKNVFGQPRLRASLRDLRSPRKTCKSTIEDDLKKLIILDSSGTEPEPELEVIPQKTLQRTLSDESLCSGRREPTLASNSCFEQPSDVAFTSTYPSSTLPVRKAASSQGGFLEKAATILASELSLAEGRDQLLRHLDPALMPLPDTASGLEWSSLVSAAKAYEVQRAVSLFSLHEAAATLSPDPLLQPASLATPTMSEQRSAGDLPGKVYQLELLLRQLHSDLQKEKEDKAALQAEVATLRQNNQRLQEESQTASERLRKFAQIFSAGTVEEEEEEL